MQLREPSLDENPDVLHVHRLAFGRDDEAALVYSLLHDPSAQPVLSVVAELQGKVVGHALFTTVRVASVAAPVDGAILAPLAVLPSRQRAGIGRSLIEHGCGALAARNVPLVFVLGDPGYYTRSRFVPALPSGLRAPYAIEPEAAWMVRALIPDVLGSVRGTVRCARSLAAEQYWRE
jgi:putative acetyltransferase